jgi:hypothetical protein
VNKRNRNDQGAIALVSLVLGLVVIGVAWHVAARDLVAPQYRFNMGDLVRETSCRQSDQDRCRPTLSVPEEFLSSG